MPGITFKPSSGDGDKPLASLRKDLKFFDGPVDPGGTPTYTLYDPVRAQYFRLTWAEAQVLERLQPGLTAKQLATRVNRETTLKVTEQDIQLLMEDMGKSRLLDVTTPSEMLIEEAQRRKWNPLYWLLYNYLFIKIPLVNPNDFLDRTLHYVKPLLSKWAIYLYVFVSLAGLITIVTSLEEYLYTFPYFFNIQGIFAYSLALISVKCLHELAHAYTAKYYGVRVPAIGVAFLVLWPVLFTDVTDGWKLSSRRKRFAISAAGVAFELVLAGLMTLLWAAAPEGVWRSLFFVLSSASLLSTLAVNLNPAMRFDGYYLLSDAWGIDNLQWRAFAIARWKLRKSFLGIDVPPPEEGHTESRILGMIVYSVYTWIYRLILYTTIAVFVYLKFTKALGLFLFIVEIVVFIFLPIKSEVEQLYALREHFRINKRLTLTLTILAVFLGWYVIPWPHPLYLPAVTSTDEEQVVYIPVQGQVLAAYVDKGDHVQKGWPLVAVESQELDKEIESIQLDKAIAEKEIDQIISSDEQHSKLSEKLAELKRLEADLRILLALKNRMLVKALVTGVVYEWDPLLHEDQYVAKDQVVGRIANLKKMEVTAYAPERDIHYLHEGDAISFRISASKEEYSGKIVEVSPTREVHLRHPQLSSEAQGDLAVTSSDAGQLKLIDAHYAVRIRFEGKKPELALGETGYAIVHGKWRSKFMELWRFITAVLWRESGF